MENLQSWSCHETALGETLEILLKLTKKLNGIKWSSEEKKHCNAAIQWLVCDFFSFLKCHLFISLGCTWKPSLNIQDKIRVWSTASSLCLLVSPLTSTCIDADLKHWMNNLWFKNTDFPSEHSLDQHNNVGFIQTPFYAGGTQLMTTIVIGIAIVGHKAKHHVTALIYNSNPGTHSYGS